MSLPNDAGRLKVLDFSELFRLLCSIPQELPQLVLERLGATLIELSLPSDLKFDICRCYILRIEAGSRVITSRLRSTSKLGLAPIICEARL